MDIYGYIFFVILVPELYLQNFRITEVSLKLKKNIKIFMILGFFNPFQIFLRISDKKEVIFQALIYLFSWFFFNFNFFSILQFLKCWFSANSARDPPSSMSRVPLRRSYRDAGQAMSVEKKEKKVSGFYFFEYLNFAREPLEKSFETDFFPIFKKFLEFLNSNKNNIKNNQGNKKK